MLSAYRQPDGKCNGTRCHYQPSVICIQTAWTNPKVPIYFQSVNDTLYLHWELKETPMAIRQLRHAPKALKTAVRLSFLQPERRTAYLSPIQKPLPYFPATAFQELKSQKAFHYNQTEYQLADTKSQAMGYSLLHVNDSVDGCEMWIMDNPDFPSDMGNTK